MLSLPTSDSLHLSKSLSYSGDHEEVKSCLSREVAVPRERETAI